MTAEFVSDQNAKLQQLFWNASQNIITSNTQPPHIFMCVAQQNVGLTQPSEMARSASFVNRVGTVLLLSPLDSPLASAHEMNHQEELTHNKQLHCKLQRFVQPT